MIYPSWYLTVLGTAILGYFWARQKRKVETEPSTCTRCNGRGKEVCWCNRGWTEQPAEKCKICDSTGYMPCNGCIADIPASPRSIRVNAKLKI